MFEGQIFMQKYVHWCISYIFNIQKMTTKVGFVALRILRDLDIKTPERWGSWNDNLLFAGWSFRLGLQHRLRVPDAQLEIIYFRVSLPCTGCAGRNHLHAGESSFPAWGQVKCLQVKTCKIRHIYLSCLCWLRMATYILTYKLPVFILVVSVYSIKHQAVIG